MLQDVVVYRPVLVNRSDIIVMYLDGLYSSKAAVIDLIRTNCAESKFAKPYTAHPWVAVIDELGTLATAEILFTLMPSNTRVGYISMAVK